MLTNVIIGKNSNLSNQLSFKIDNCFLVSSRDLLDCLDSLEAFKDKEINVIFNNFQPATQLGVVDSTESYINNSIVVTTKVLDYFAKSKINKIIYTSSSSVYGNNILCNEKDELKPLNLHASLKVANEKLVENFCLKNNIDFTIARIFNIYGGDDKFSIVSKIINACKTKDELLIVNNGNAIRDFIYIDDVVKAYKKLLVVKNIPVINVGTSNGISIRSILEYLKNNGANLKTKNIIKNELKISTADNSLLLGLLGNISFVEVESYLKKELNL
jgi:nucleoside-diphosphate-sugar epimerase